MGASMTREEAENRQETPPHPSDAELNDISECELRDLMDDSLRLGPRLGRVDTATGLGCVLLDLFLGGEKMGKPLTAMLGAFRLGVAYARRKPT